MATIGGSNIVKSGLVLDLDAANQRSYAGSGATWNDLSGNFNIGSLINGPTFNSANNGIFTFNGTNNYCQIVTNPISSNSSFTLSCWINITTLNSTYRPLIDGGNLGVGSAGYTLSIDNTNRIFIACNSGYKSINTSLSINQWYNVVGVATFGTPYIHNIYVNSILGATFGSATSNNMTNNVSYIRIAQNAIVSGGTLYYAGSVSQTQIYNRALSASEVLQNYEAQKTRFGL